MKMQAIQAKPARAGGWIAHLWPADLNCCVFQATWIFPTFPGFLPSGPGYIPKWTDSDISTFSVGVYFLSSPNTWPTKDSLIVSHLRGAGEAGVWLDASLGNGGFRAWVTILAGDL